MKEHKEMRKFSMEDQVSTYLWIIKIMAQGFI